MFPTTQPINNSRTASLSAQSLPITNNNMTAKPINPHYAALQATLLPRLDDGEIFVQNQDPSENIILDMDGCLLDAITPILPENPVRYKEPVPVARPGLRKLLRYVFSKYKHVSIWTAAHKSWFDKCYKEVISPNMPPGASFHFVRTHPIGTPRVPLKALRIIYAEYPGEYTAENTTIVDDNSETFQDNIANAECVPHYYYDLLGPTEEVRRTNAAEDDGLFKLIERLKVRMPGNTATVEATTEKTQTIFDALIAICASSVETSFLGESFNSYAHSSLRNCPKMDDDEENDDDIYS